MDGQHRRFGAARKHAGPGPRASERPYLTDTLDFARVARERGRPPSHRSGSWTEDGRDYNFGEDAREDRSYSEQRREAPPPQHPPKYASRPKASGQSISTPGSSIVNTVTSTMGVNDGVLRKVFAPPKKQSSFLESITQKNTNLNRGVRGTLKMKAYSTTSSLESASAPAPKKDVPIKPIGTSGWKSKRVPAPAPKPRTLLASTDKRMKLSDEPPKPPVVSRHYELRDRRPKLFEHSPTSTEPFTLRSSRSTRLGKRKMNSEGSAEKPIALDSDSESEPEVQAASTSLDETATVAEGSNGSEKDEAKEDREEKPPAIDLEEISLHAAIRMHNCEVMIGLFQCVVDLFFQGDRVCMRSIRAKYDKWPLKSFYLFSLVGLQDARHYKVPKEAEASSEINVEEPDRMEQLLGEASFIALKLPLSEEEDRVAMRSFYDPAGSDVPKGYVILRPLDDAPEDNLEDIVDLLRGHTDIQSINDKEHAKEHLQALVDDPYSYRPSQRSSRRKSTEGTEDSPSESDDDDVDANVKVLTYPLPPCTSDVVTIIRHDVSRLKPRRYLNDNIIDYYFKRMMLETFRDNKIVQEKVLFLSSHFYSRLRAGKGPNAIARMEAGYKNVSTWLARSNFFSRSIIFIPINKDVHWSLAVILNPGIAGTNPSNEEAFSCIAVLDPLGSYHRKAAIIRNLRAFLRMEWANSLGRSGNDEADQYGIDRVMPLEVKAPMQENSYDCGVYVLKFAEVMLQSCLDLGLLSQNEGVIGRDVTDEKLIALITPSAFSAEDITATRKKVRECIEVDAKEYQVRKGEKEASKASKAKHTE